MIRPAGLETSRTVGMLARSGSFTRWRRQGLTITTCTGLWTHHQPLISVVVSSRVALQALAVGSCSPYPLSLRDCGIRRLIPSQSSLAVVNSLVSRGLSSLRPRLRCGRICLPRSVPPMVVRPTGHSWVILVLVLSSGVAWWRRFSRLRASTPS